MPLLAARGLAKPTQRGCCWRTWGSASGARMDSNGHSVSLWQVPWLKQSRSPLPPHARSQPGLCNMYKVRRAPAPPAPPAPHRELCSLRCPIGGQCLGHLPVQGAQQVVYGICKSHFAKPGGQLPGRASKGQRAEAEEVLASEECRVNPRRVLCGQARQGPRGSGQWTSPLGRADQGPFLRARAEVA